VLKPDESSTSAEHLMMQHLQLLQQLWQLLLKTSP
jgi:hypothetical protein